SWSVSSAFVPSSTGRWSGMPNAESPDQTACRSGSPHGVFSGVHVLPVAAELAAFATLLSRVWANSVEAVNRTTSACAQVTENRTFMAPAPSAATGVGRPHYGSNRSLEEDANERC